MHVQLYYAPYPSQRFRGEEQPLSTVRVLNPKSALVTLAAGVRRYLDTWGIDADLRIIDTQVDGGETYYKSFRYGPRTVDCHRVGGDFAAYEDTIRQADICGISNNFTNSAGIVTDFAQALRTYNPRCLFVAGGMDATARPDYYLERGFDVVVQLEGELSLARIVEARARGVPLAELVPTEVRPHGLVVSSSSMLDMDQLPPMALDLVDGLERYTDTGEGVPPATVRPPFTCFETSRGCHQTCSFCATPMRGRYRFMSPRAVERHLRHFRDAGVNNLLFQEDNILSRVQRVGRQRNLLYDTGRDETIEIFHMARDYGFSWEFANGLEFGKFVDIGEIDTELMGALFWNDQTGERWRGCYRVQIPLEFLGDDPTRKYRKLRSFETELEILDAVLDFGVDYQTFNVIIGHPGDDDAAIATYLDRCLQLRDALLARSPQMVPYFNVFNRTLLPGTRDYREQRHQLEFDIERDPEVISVYLSPMNTDTLTYYELFQHRVRMVQELNGTLVDQYDGIHHVLDRAALADSVAAGPGSAPARALDGD